MCRPTSIVEAGVQSYGLAAPIPNSKSGAALAGPCRRRFLASKPWASLKPVSKSRSFTASIPRPSCVTWGAKTGCSELARELANEAFLRIIRLAPAKLRSIEQPQAYLWSIAPTFCAMGRGQGAR